MLKAETTSSSHPDSPSPDPKTPTFSAPSKCQPHSSFEGLSYSCVGPLLSPPSLPWGTLAPRSEPSEPPVDLPIPTL